EAQGLAAYINPAHRLNWAFGGSQDPLYFYLPTQVQSNPSDPNTVILTPRLERFVIRDIFAQGYYPFSRFTRVEIGGHFANITQDTLRQDYLLDRGSGAVLGIADPVTGSGPSVSYYRPPLARGHHHTSLGLLGPLSRRSFA